jgi:hypothetical protein
MTWRDRGGPRPVALPRRVPAACWARRAAIVAARTRPGQPVPTHWKLPIAFTTWGFRNGQFSADWLADQLAKAGVRSIAIQIGEADPSVAGAFHRLGLAVYLWGRPSPGDQAALDKFRADGWIPQVETNDQYQALLLNLAGGVGAELLRAVVTNFEGINATHEGVKTPERMAALTAAGITTAFVECYSQDDPAHRDLTRMIAKAREYGWSNAVPVVGLFHGVRLSEYDLTGFGRDWGVYNVESLDPADWPAIAAEHG